MSFLNITDPKKRDVDDYLATVKRLQRRDINEREQDLAWKDDLNQMFEPVVKSTGKSTQAIREEVAPIREEMKTLNGHLADTTAKMKDAITAKQQQQQQPTDETNVLEQMRQMFIYVEDVECSINISRFNMLVLKQLKLMEILTSL